MKRLLLIPALLLALCLKAVAQVNLDEEFFSLPDSVTNEYLDTVVVKQAAPNDYWMAGVYGGASLQYGYFNPTRLLEWQVQYPVYGFSVVRYYTMFGLFHNMGMEFGAQMNYEGYNFKENKETSTRSSESGAYWAKMRVPEVFFLSHFHYDIGDHFKLMAKLGLYGGYRLDIHREIAPQYADYPDYSDYADSFHDYENRYTYGVQGGIGAAIMISPFEFHLTAQVKWGWNSFWRPDYSSPYYYRFGYPLDGAITFGVYYQLTPRLGHSRGDLRKLARKMVQEQNND